MSCSRASRPRRGARLRLRRTCREVQVGLGGAQRDLQHARVPLAHGQIVPAGRDGRGRRWALADRWFGASRRESPGAHDAVRAAAFDRCAPSGSPPGKQVRAHFLRRPLPGLDGIWATLETEGEILPWISGSVATGMCTRVTSTALAADRSRRLRAAVDVALAIRQPHLRPRSHRLRCGASTSGSRSTYRNGALGLFRHAPSPRGPPLDTLRRCRRSGRRQPQGDGERWEPGWKGSKRPPAVRSAFADLASFVGAGPPLPR